MLPGFKHLLYGLLIAVTHLQGNSQDVKKEWLLQLGGKDNELVQGLVLDKNANVYVIGNFESNITIAGTSIPTPENGMGFVAKFDTDGHLLWIKQVDGVLYRIAGDKNGNIVVAGKEINTFMIGETKVNCRFDPACSLGPFLIKFNSDGTLLWRKDFPRSENYKSHDLYLYHIEALDVNENGDILIFFQCHSEVKYDLDGKLYVWRSMVVDNFEFNAGLGNAVAALMDRNGTIIWREVLGGSQLSYQPPQTMPLAIHLDDDGTIYLTGTFVGTLKIGSQEVHNETGAYMQFYSRIDPGRNCSWIKTVTRGDKNGFPLGWNGIMSDMLTDADKNLYVTGTFDNWINLNGTQLLETETTDASGAVNFDGYIAKLDRDGNFLWAKKLSRVFTTSKLVEQNNRLYIAGLATQSGSSENPLYGLSLYAVLLDHDGSDIFSFVTTAMGWGNNLFGFGVDEQGSIYFGHSFVYNWDPLVNMSGEILRDNGMYTAYDGFIVKYHYCQTKIADAPTTINGPDEVCNSDVISLQIDPVENAFGYDWEITNDGSLHVETTSETVLTIQSDSDIKIRVRGKGECEDGNFSGEKTIKIEKPFIPDITKDCEKIIVTKKPEEGVPIEWFLNQAQLTTDSLVQMELFPQDSGLFHVQIRNACGIQKSNDVYFAPANVNFVSIPNVITPNDDGLNEYFILDQQLKESSIQIYNRWGQEVYQSPSYQNDFDGRNLPVGIYYFEIHNLCYQHPIRGPLTILR